MSDTNLCIVGLGNPGSKYHYNRHNVGFLVVDELARRWGITLSSMKWQCEGGRERKWGARIYLVKPQTFMNRSGNTVSELARFYRIAPEEVLVIHDDLDMHPGRLKLVKGGGAGGHNGIRSIVQQLGNKDFLRLKVGIGRPGKGDVHPEIPVESYVLSDMSRTEQDLLEERCDAIEDGIRLLLDKGSARAMSHLNSFK